MLIVGGLKLIRERCIQLLGVGIRDYFMPTVRKLLEHPKPVFISCLYITILGCATSNPPPMSEGHIGRDAATEDKSAIPPILTHAPMMPRPTMTPAPERYTVVVNDVPLRDLLFSLARDAQMNLDIDNDIDGRVTLNAIQQTLPQILDRITEMTEVRYEIAAGDNLVVRVDKPYFKSYRVNYLNVGRTAQTSVSVATQIGTTGQGASTGSGGGGGDDLNNNSQTMVMNTSNNQFWDTLESNIATIIGVQQAGESGDSGAAAASGAEGAPAASGAPARTPAQAAASSDSADEVSTMIVNREAGVVAVKATAQQHREVLAFLNEILYSAKRQVLIEATIAEVTLNDRFQAGIDWSMIQNGDLAALNNQTNPTGSNLIQDLTGSNLGSAPSLFFRLTDTDFEGSRIDVTLKSLEQFGDVKIMSSPKLMALNNQTALLKVVDNIIYFSIEVDVSTNESGNVTRTDFETNINTIPVGFVMSVTPFIDEHDAVTLNIRPTISRVIGQARDPNPALAEANVISEIPIVQVREIESVLSVNSGEVAVIGGLMQDDQSETEVRVPVLGSIPVVGDLFKYRDHQYSKTELVIFIRPEVIEEADLGRDLKEFSTFMPKAAARPPSKKYGARRATRLSFEPRAGATP